MTLASMDVVAYTAYFLIPGFIVAETVNSIIPGKRRSDAEKILIYLGYSILNFGCWFWALRLLYKVFSKNTSWYWALLIVGVLLSGFITGCLIGFLKSHNPSRWIMERLQIPIEHPIPTAWEYKFSQMNEGKYVTVCLDNGKKIRGAFFNKSLASSDVTNKDIYIENVFFLDEKDNWRPVDGSDGVWISSGAIKWISFLEKKGIEK